MRIPRILGGKVLAIAIAMTMLPAAIPSATPLVGVSSAEAQSYYGGYRDGPRNFRRGGGYYDGQRYYGGRQNYRGRDYYRHRGNRGGSALAGAIVGLGVGAAIASAAQPRYYEAPRYAAPRYAAPVYGARPWTREWYRYCASRYRSFDPASGTFQPYNGPRQLCR